MLRKGLNFLHPCSWMTSLSGALNLWGPTLKKEHDPHGPEKSRQETNATSFLPFLLEDLARLAHWMTLPFS